MTDRYVDLTKLDDDEYEAAASAVAEVRRSRLAAVLGADPVVVFMARQNADLTEGRGPWVSRGTFFLRSDADEAVTLLEGVMGTPNDGGVEALNIYASVNTWLLKLKNDIVLNGSSRVRQAKVKSDNLAGDF